MMGMAFTKRPIGTPHKPSNQLSDQETVRVSLFFPLGAILGDEPDWRHLLRVAPKLRKR
jgi:hypothetical protein